MRLYLLRAKSIDRIAIIEIDWLIVDKPFFYAWIGVPEEEWNEMIYKKGATECARSL